MKNIEVRDAANCCDRKGAVVRAYKDRLCFKIGDTTDTEIALHSRGLFGEFCSERRILNAVDRLIKAVFFAVNSHTGAACAEVGVIVNTVKKVENAILFGCYAKITAHTVITFLSRDSMYEISFEKYILIITKKVR